MLKAEEIIELLNLEPLVGEGGFFRRTYFSNINFSQNLLSPEYNGTRSIASAIYYFLTPDTFSEMHKLLSDEIFHFYLGDKVEMLQLHPDGNGKIITIGNDLAAGIYPQVLVPALSWQGLRLVSGGSYALLGTTMSPAFDYQDYTSGKRDDLIKLYPQYKELITSLTNK
ncbi:MAG: cupin domain-containing protein [Blastocatellia bacterium]|nr:cupin domain-containing protein [Blastocatellia bacterium]